MSGKNGKVGGGGDPQKEEELGKDLGTDPQKEGKEEDLGKDLGKVHSPENVIDEKISDEQITQLALRKLKSHQTAALAATTKKRHQIMTLMADERQVHLVKSMSDEYIVQWDQYQACFEEVLEEITDHGQKQEAVQSYDEKELIKIGFMTKVTNWIVETEHKLMDAINQFEAQSIRTNGSKGSTGSRKSVVLKEKARVAELLKQKQQAQKKAEIAQQQAQLKAQEQILNIDTEIMMALAREKVYADDLQQDNGEINMPHPTTEEFNPKNDIYHEPAPPRYDQHNVHKTHDEKQQASHSHTNRPHNANRNLFQEDRKASQKHEFNSHNANSTLKCEQLEQTTTEAIMHTQQQMATALFLPQPQIPVFDGDPIDYMAFIIAFDTRIVPFTATDADRLYYLNQHLKSDPKDAIEGCLYMHPDIGYQEARTLLQKEYGDPFKVATAYVNKALNWPAVKNDDGKALKQLSYFLNKCSHAMKTLSHLTVLSHTPNMQALVKKLPGFMQNKWRDQATSLRQKQRTVEFKDLVEFIDKMAESLNDPIYGKVAMGRTESSIVNRRQNQPKANSTSLNAVQTSVENKTQCKLCHKSHHLDNCFEFKKKGIEERRVFVRENRLCFGCFEENHQSKNCTTRLKCKECGKRHPSTMHEENFTPYVKKTEDAQADHQTPRKDQDVVRTKDVQTDTNKTFNTQCTPIALRTTPVTLKHGRRRVQVNALLDDGSTRTYINEDVAAHLGLQGTTKTVSVNVLNGQTETFETMPVEFNLESLDGRVDIKMIAYTTTKVTGNMEATDWEIKKDNYDHLKDIPFPTVNKNKPIIDMLIGIDYPELHISHKDVVGSRGEPTARLTPLGWTCVGNPNPDKNDTSYMSQDITFFVHDHEKQLNATLRKFWEIEELPQTPDQGRIITDPTNKTVAVETEKNLTYDGERYQVTIPWKNRTQMTIPDSYEMALKRLKAIEKKLQHNPKMEADYSKIIEKYEEKGYIERVTEQHRTLQKWYLPHFPVIRPDKTTTKTRIVFDAAATCQNTSLNSLIHEGPKLQNELFNVLIRFRRYPVALICDISEMYLQIKITPSDRPYHRFLWRSLNQEEDPTVFQFTRLLFGENCAPYLALFVAYHHALKHREEYPKGAEAILKSTYMDDTLESVEGDEEGINLYRQLSQLWARAGMHARKWHSNSTRVLSEIPEQDRATDYSILGGDEVKTLGVVWRTEEDMLTFHAIPQEDSTELTKRKFLKKVASVFDPLGLLGPYVIRGKVLIQEMWASGLEWDDPLTDELQRRARIWLAELAEVGSLTVHRSLQIDSIVSVRLHAFVDSSKDAYGAVVYIRNELTDGSFCCNIVAAKAKVAPLKATSIPRLELMGAMLGLKLCNAICKVFEICIKGTATFWCDSTDVLYWIRGSSRHYKTFVANRVGEIQTYTNPEQWRHVPTKENPADLLTRGNTPRELGTSSFWLTGPDFLSKEECEWPEKKIPGSKSQQKNELIAKHRTMIITDSNSDNWRLEPERFSKWNRLIRVSGWVHRFIHNCQSKTKVTGELGEDELREIEHSIIRDAQKSCFPLEYNALQSGRRMPVHSKIQNLNPKLDEDGLMRSDGRLVYADTIPFNTRYPIILPRNSWVTKLITAHSHERGNHSAGTNQTLAALSSKYWIVSGREAIREVEKECNECHRRKVQPGNQIMAPLPKVRIALPYKAFTHTAVDYGGPFTTVQGRGKRREKRYLCLFTCMQTRAVHLEMAFALDTDSFMNAFYRMVNRRGVPTKVLSDNGTNFVGAVRELKALLQQVDQNKVMQNTANKGIQWTFNPPAAPHFGGIHESMIKAAKRAVYAIVGGADVTDEELLTAFSGAEDLINSRPLTYQSSDPKDNVPLTPNHFLHGQLGGQFAPESVDNTDFSPRKRWRRVQELMRHFWQRWMREILPSLNPRKKWFREQKDLSVGDVVIMVYPDTPRGQWPLGRITAVHPGKDGHIRVVKVKVNGTEYLRPVTRVCPLDIAQ